MRSHFDCRFSYLVARSRSSRALKAVLVAAFPRALDGHDRVRQRIEESHHAKYDFTNEFPAVLQFHDMSTPVCPLAGRALNGGAVEAAAARPAYLVTDCRTDW